MKNRLRPIQMNRISKASLAALMVTLIVFVGVTALRADNRDTVDDVIRVGRDARAGLTDFEAALRKAQAITGRLAQDRAFAVSVLELAKKGDKVGIANKRGTGAPGTQITVKSIRDFTIDISYCDKNICYALCIGDDCKHPSGAKSPVVFNQF